MAAMPAMPAMPAKAAMAAMAAKWPVWLAVVPAIPDRILLDNTLVLALYQRHSRKGWTLPGVVDYCEL